MMRQSEAEAESDPEYFVLDLSLKKRKRTSSSDDSDVDPRDTNNDRPENLYKSLAVLKDDLDDPQVVRRGI